MRVVETIPAQECLAGQDAVNRMSSILEDVDRFCREVRGVRNLLDDIHRRDERIKQLLKELEDAERQRRTWRKTFRRAPEWEVERDG